MDVANAVAVPCGHCKGTGRRGLPQAMLRTLDAMSVDEWRTANEIRERAHMTSDASTTVTNRLAALMAMGLVERGEQRGRQWLWRKGTP